MDTFLPRSSCGRCTFCCTTLQITALAKAAWTPCEKLGKGRPCCADYANRPAECVNFRCLWLRGMLPEGWRPDKVGVMFSLHQLPGAAEPFLLISGKTIAPEVINYARTASTPYPIVVDRSGALTLVLHEKDDRDPEAVIEAIRLRSP